MNGSQEAPQKQLRWRSEIRQLTAKLLLLSRRDKLKKSKPDKFIPKVSESSTGVHYYIEKKITPNAHYAKQFFFFRYFINLVEHNHYHHAIEQLLFVNEKYSLFLNDSKHCSTQLELYNCLFGDVI